MGSHFGVRLVCLVSALAIIQGIHEIQYQVYYFTHDVEVKNRFKNEIGYDVAVSIMEKATEFVWDKVLEQSSSNERKDVRKIYLVIDGRSTTDVASHAKESSHEYIIYIDAAFIKTYVGDFKSKITGLIYFEIASILQWATPDDRKTMLRIAYFAILKANCQPKTLIHDGDGDKWDTSIEVTARFLVYCNDRKSGFVAFLNSKMYGASFNEIYFQEFFEKSLDDLWKDYKHKYSDKV